MCHLFPDDLASRVDRCRVGENGSRHIDGRNCALLNRKHDRCRCCRRSPDDLAARADRNRDR